MTYEDQEQMLNSLEDSVIYAHKGSLHTKVRADCSVIASANPRGSKFKAGDSGDDKVEIEDIPALVELIDRFDIIFIFKKSGDTNYLDELAEKMMDKRRHNAANYEALLSTFLIYIKSEFRDIKVIPEAHAMLV